MPAAETATRGEPHHRPTGSREPSTDPAKTVNVFRQEHFAKRRLVPPMASTLPGGVGRASTRVFLQEHISILQRPLGPGSGLQIHFKRYETFLQEHNAGFCTEFRKPCDILRCI